MLLVVQGLLVSCSRTEEEEASSEVQSKSFQVFVRTMCLSLTNSMESIYVPTIRLFLEEDAGSNSMEKPVYALLPVYEYAVEQVRREQREVTARRILWEEAHEELTEKVLQLPDEFSSSEEASSSGKLILHENLSEETIQESIGENTQEPMEEVALETNLNLPTGKTFLPHEKQLIIDVGEIPDFDGLLKQFYTVDSTTKANEEIMNVQSFLEKDMTIERNVVGPQILIYHTHSQEAFADSIPNDSSTTILGAGERLKEILEDTYGFQVLHHTQSYDLPNRNKAYSNAKGSIEQLLEDNPSIQVVIDLHRDSMPENTRQVVEIDGRPTAKFMFFNGMSYNRKTGPITYLKNENLESNLAFSFQMQKAANEYYPGVTRKIYLKDYRYNMHLKDKYLLIELGAQNNTVEEIMNACDILGHLLYLVLTGLA